MSGIAYVIETYGIIYNKELVKKAGYSPDDIKTLTASRKLQKTSQQIRTNLDFQHLHQQVWTDLLTGDSKHIWQTFQSTMNTKMKEL